MCTKINTYSDKLQQKQQIMSHYIKLYLHLFLVLFIMSDIFIDLYFGSISNEKKRISWGKKINIHPPLLF